MNKIFETEQIVEVKETPTICKNALKRILHETLAPIRHTT